jgi:hypothetical protein
MHWVAYEFKGGPLDGERFEEPIGSIPDDTIGEFLTPGGHLYRTNGPTDVVATEIDLDYVGKVAPSHGHPRVMVRHYEIVD